STAISCPPAGSFSSNGAASHAYRRLANGSSASRITTTPASARISRARSSSRWSMRLLSAAGSGLAWFIRLLALVRRRIIRRRQRRGVLDLVAHRVQAVANAVGLLAQCRMRLAQLRLGLLEAAAQFLGLQFALQLGLDRIPLRARAAHP